MPPIKFFKTPYEVYDIYTLSEKSCCQNFIPSIKVIDMTGLISSRRFIFLAI